MTEDPFIQAVGLVKIFKVADLEVVALQGLDLEIAQGEFLALVGPSGSGKSTLLSAIGGLDRPSAGRLTVGGRNLLALSQRELTDYRRRDVGFIWQQTARNLLPYLTARENVELLMTLAGRGWGERRAWADELLDAVGMSEHARKRPPELSGGQQQRVAIACALANRPRILLGDEPTGEVDWPTAQMILALLRDLRDRYGITVVTVTHDPRVAAQADRTVAIRDGRTSTETVRVVDDDLAVAGNGATGPRGERADAPALSVAAPPPRIAHEELVVVDQAGRLQIPGEQRALAGIGRRAKVELVDGGILIRPGDDDRSEADEDAPDDGAAIYRSLYSGDPPPAPKARRSWWRRR